jgi:hypothetical protein
MPDGDRPLADALNELSVLGTRDALGAAQCRGRRVCPGKVLCGAG